MDSSFIEFILWLGFAMLVWAMRDSLGQVESLIELRKLPLPEGPEVRFTGFSSPQQLIEPIGLYLDRQIFHYAVIDGKTYSFDHVCPSEMREVLGRHERCVAPGLVYVECRACRRP